MKWRASASDSASVLLLVLILAGGLSLGLITTIGSAFWEGKNDFFAFYAGAKLAGSNDLYETGVQYEMQHQVLQGSLPAVVYIRLPFYALLLRPLAWLDYQIAWRVFLILNASVAIWLYWRFFWGEHFAALMAAAYPPAYMALVNGQDVWLVAGMAAGAVVLMNRGTGFAGGLLFSLCLIKPHLFLFVPLVLAFHRKWRFLAGAVSGGFVLLLLSFWAGGRNWLDHYLALIGSPLIHPGADIMPNLWGLTLTLSIPSWLVWTLAGLVALLVLFLIVWTREFEVALAGALAGALLLAPHAYLSDTALLLLAFAFLMKRGLPRMTLAAWMLLLSPVPAVCVALRAPWAAVAPLAILLALVSLLLTPLRRSQQEIPAAENPSGA